MHAYVAAFFGLAGIVVVGSRAGEWVLRGITRSQARVVWARRAAPFRVREASLAAFPWSLQGALRRASRLRGALAQRLWLDGELTAAVLSFGALVDAHAERPAASAMHPFPRVRLLRRLQAAICDDVDGLEQSLALDHVLASWMCEATKGNRVPVRRG